MNRLGIVQIVLLAGVAFVGMGQLPALAADEDGADNDAGGAHAEGHDGDADHAHSEADHAHGDADHAHGGEHGDAHAGGHGEPDIFDGSLVNSITTLVIFLIVLIVLGKFAWGPILAALQNREQFIHDSLAQAKRDRDEAETRLKEYTEQLQKAREEATGIVDEGRRDAEAVRKRVESEARAEADAMVERATREITLAKDTAISELYQLSAEMATDVAGRILRKELTPAEHQRLVSESIDEIKQLRSASEN
jgi:F-type H+-transporting ATPase subunit b